MTIALLFIFLGLYFSLTIGFEPTYSIIDSKVYC